MAHAFTVITLFPELVEAFAGIGLARKAQLQRQVTIEALNPRDFADDSRRTVDDVPYGGGPGMVMQVAPLRAAIRHARGRYPQAHVVYLSPQGRRLQQADLAGLLLHHQMILLAGRYEGIDERVVAHDVDAEWSIGDYVLSGGELPALVMVDALIRLIPGVMGDPASAQAESFTDQLLDFPHYTRPETIDGQTVPAVLLSGDHARIAAWRMREAIRRTMARRPDLLSGAINRPEVARIVAELTADPLEKSPAEG